MKDDLISAPCPVCGHTLAVNFFDGGEKPLAILGWPASHEAARAMRCYALDFMQCPQCSHVWNRSFSYEDIPYQDNPNRMFNKGGIWKGHLADTRDLLAEAAPRSPVIIDIGCGEGHFVRALSESFDGKGRFIGFDPNSGSESGRGVEFHARLFEPLADIETFTPDIIVIRHVLEHLTEPAAFVEQLAWGAAKSGNKCLLFAESPCIDRVFETGRLADFYYEHVSHFSTRSFRALLERGGDIVKLDHGYDGEVVFALLDLGVAESRQKLAAESADFARASQPNVRTVASQLEELCTSGQKVAIWGGTGKAAAFINLYGADAERFPLVVDSDPDKAGSFVPGTGQKIVFRDELKNEPVDVVIIPTQWRARDIVAEMDREDIVAGKVLIEYSGRLVDFHQDDHPYAR